MPARPAASVLLVDAAAHPWRLLMMRRPGGADFAPGAYVFPGGSVHAEDEAWEDPHRAAAIRELFEEMGILLARRSRGGSARGSDAARLSDLLDAGCSWAGGLDELGLEPASDRLAYLSRWITPELISRRFDTRFYVARRPPGQPVRPRPGEVDDWCWVSPPEALATGGVPLVHATRRILESVAGEPDVPRLIARLRRRRRESPPVRPHIVRLPDGSYEVVDEAEPGGRGQRQQSRQRS